MQENNHDSVSMQKNYSLARVVTARVYKEQL